MGAIAAVLRAAWASPSGDNCQPELDFLRGLTEAFAGRASTWRQQREREDVLEYPVPEFLRHADYESSVNVAVTGNSGVGKSLLINTVRGVRSGEVSWAPVGVRDTTRDPVWYAFPNEPRVRLWDLEGALMGQGGPGSVEAYIRGIGLRYFDVVLVLSAGRLTETELELAQELRRHELPFFFVRTKVDWDIENSQADYGSAPEEVLRDIRQDLHANGVSEPYLVNARELEDFDFPRLVRDVLLVLAARWPEFMQQAFMDEFSPSAAPTDPDTALELAEGQEPVEALARYNGRWAWSHDAGFQEFLRGEVGEVAATIAALLFAVPDHSFTINEDGSWEQLVLSSGHAPAAAGGVPLVARIVPSRCYSDEMESDFFGHCIRGRGLEYVHEGAKLVSEFSGYAKEDAGYLLHYRMIREVVNDRYIMTWQNLTSGCSGVRVFTRYPYFRILNCTDSVVSLSTFYNWSGGLVPSMTAEVEPGARLVDCSSKKTKSERAVFKLGSKTLKVPELRAWEDFSFSSDDFT